VEAYYSQSSSVANGARELGVANPLHATLDNRDYVDGQSPVAVKPEVVYAPLMPSLRVRAVLNGILKDGDEISEVKDDKL